MSVSSHLLHHHFILQQEGAAVCWSADVTAKNNMRCIFSWSSLQCVFDLVNTGTWQKSTNTTSKSKKFTVNWSSKEELYRCCCWMLWESQILFNLHGNIDLYYNLCFSSNIYIRCCVFLLYICDYFLTDLVITTLTASVWVHTDAFCVSEVETRLAKTTHS